MENNIGNSAMDNYLRCARINIPDNVKNIPEDWLSSAISDLKKYLVKEGKFKLQNAEGKDLSEAEFIAMYESRTRLQNFFVKCGTSTGQFESLENAKIHIIDGNKMQDSGSPNDEKSDKLSIAEQTGQNNILNVIPCPYCGQAFATEEETINHGVKFHPRKPIAAELAKMRESQN